ncbi:Hypothetical protein OINT_1000587 [Brucella intermedia LMG 3301]|uniref:Uncharacterized protein n=1 Tax=Brucella intermedia LMG 3301 TaxID=641118 RepID=C4WJK3_9HYPH|nr:Hypothetical protein OINT_1000587 [Brucella intermedia LMG 3301]
MAACSLPCNISLASRLHSLIQSRLPSETRWEQVGVEDRLDPVLLPETLADQLRLAGNLPSKRKRFRVRYTDLRLRAGGLELREDSCIGRNQS